MKFEAINKLIQILTDANEQFSFVGISSTCATLNGATSAAEWNLR
jgi:hypothetical protein